MNELSSKENETTQEETPETGTEIEATAPETETEETPVEETEEKKVDPQQSWKDVNLKLKQQADDVERLKKENELYHKFLNQRENQQQPAKQEEAFDINKLPDDDLVEYSSIKKVRKQDQAYYQKLEERLIMAEMRYKNKDFDEVFTQTNLQALRDADPDLAEAILATKSQEKQARMAYNAIKRYGIVKNTVEKETAMLSEYNTARPKPSNAATPSQTKSALSHAAGFQGVPMTKKIREEIYKRAVEKARQR